MSLIPRVLGNRGMATAASMPGVLVAPAARMLLANNPGKLTVEALAKTSLGRMPNGFTVITKVSPRTCRSSCVGRVMLEPIGIMGPSPLRAGERRCECVWPCGLTRTVDSRKNTFGLHAGAGRTSSTREWRHAHSCKYSCLAHVTEIQPGMFLVFPPSMPPPPHRTLFLLPSACVVRN